MKKTLLFATITFICLTSAPIVSVSASEAGTSASAHHIVKRDQMTDGVDYSPGIRPLGKGGQKCGLGILGGLASIPGNPLGWIVGGISAIDGCRS
ncbi:hypothetical protein BGL52_11415 [Lacticaseibacillus casei]|uniref:Uncharacterized protein n=1 Tax=Lacticaseibacillus casei TaxID=1582 RepID=A0AAN1KF03_LACCA|nr:hypothetical protein BGL52_11415 [Lacticaseibacillus casei]